MGLLPKLDESCFCCTIKTGSFVTAWFILVGASVQTGYYAFLVDHMYPQRMCVTYENVIVKVNPPPQPERPTYPDYDYDGFIRYRFPGKNERPYKEVAPSTTANPNNASHQAKLSTAVTTTDSVQANSSTAAKPTDSVQGNSSTAANTTGSVQANSSKPAKPRGGGGRHRFIDFQPLRRWGWRLWNFHPYPREQVVTQSFMRPCSRDYKPFDADNDFLDFELRGDFDRSILYFNLVIWATMMAATPVLMVGVYKESECLVTLWLLAEILLLLAGTASTIATATFMFGVVPVQIGVVTLLNMAIHLGIDIYLLLVVANYRQQLINKDAENENDNNNDADETEVVQVAL